jgi:hypothetical protein
MISVLVLTVLKLTFFFLNKRGYSSLNNLKSFKLDQSQNYPTLVNQIKLVSRVIIKYINSVF